MGRPIKRIIFLSLNRFSQREYDRLGIDQLKRKGFRVEYWETNLIAPPEPPTTGTPKSNHAFDGLRRYNGDGVLLEALEGLTACDVLVALTNVPHIKMIKVFRQISRSKAYWGTVQLGEVPVALEENNLLIRLQKFAKNPGLIWKFILIRISLKWLGIRAFDFYLVGGDSPPCNKAHLSLIDVHTQWISAHSFDYDCHLLAPRRASNAASTENVVFLDEYGPFHPDFEFLGCPAFPCGAEEYFANLNSFFHLVEERFGCSVIIAAHPKSRYEERGNLFEERSIVRGNTRQLVQEAKFVLAASSTAVSFAVIYSKPIVFLAINPRVQNFLDNRIQHLASQFGKQPVHWTGKGNVDWDRELVIDKKRYTDYMTAYIKKPGSPEMSCWEIFANYLETLPG